jgi:CubicO group peptidase (beta-lactamase class C family)
MKRLLTPFLALALATGLLAQTPSAQHSAPLSDGTPAEVGLSPERLSRIDAAMQRAIDAGKIPGIAYLVARHGKIVHVGALGTANADGKPLTDDAIFRIASMTKAITTTAVMMLWEEGYFRLDDPVADFLPEFANPVVLEAYDKETGHYVTRPAKGPITIRQLLTHQSGIGYGIIDRNPDLKQIFIAAGTTDLFTTEPVVLADNIKKVAAQPLAQDPGGPFHYSLGLDVAGRLVEVVSGLSYDEFLRTHIFEPLGMVDTQFYLREDQLDRLVDVQQPGEDGGWITYEGTEHYDTAYPAEGARSYFSGGAGLTSTLRDYAAFLQMYLNGGEYNGVRLLSRTTIATMMTMQTELRPYLDMGLGFGLLNDKGVNEGGQGPAGTFSGGGYFNTGFFASAEEGILALNCKQTRHQQDDDSGWIFRQLVFAAIDD